MQVIDFILQTVDPSNSVMRKTCFQSSMSALKEVARAFPMVALNDTWTKLAVGDVIGEKNNASIRVYDMQRYSKNLRKGEKGHFLLFFASLVRLGWSPGHCCAGMMKKCILVCACVRAFNVIL